VDNPLALHEAEAENIVVEETRTRETSVMEERSLFECLNDWAKMVRQSWIDTLTYQLVWIQNSTSWDLELVIETDCCRKNACRLMLVVFSLHRSHDQGS
jgi:hypothetical protein